MESAFCSVLTKFASALSALTALRRWPFGSELVVLEPQHLEGPMQAIQTTPLPVTAQVGEILLSADLLHASYRSDTFPQGWTKEQRLVALERYKKWLRLKQHHLSSPLAPTRDIDLFWHLHMLSPVAYCRDCMRLFGKILDHDGGFGKDPSELPELKRVFTQTAEWWEQMYGEPFREDGSWMRDAVITDCWHDCSNRCWHACSSK